MKYLHVFPVIASDLDHIPRGFPGYEYGFHQCVSGGGAASRSEQDFLQTRKESNGFCIRFSSRATLSPNPRVGD